VLGALLSLLVRFIRSRGEERQQIKWFMALAVVGISSLVSVSVVSALLPSGNSSGALVVNFLQNLLWIIVPASLPIAVGIAILRYRLYDIDHIINRTLVYAALTALLAAGYFGTIMALQGIGSLVFQAPFRAITGQEAQLATVAATLAMAALFSPLRRRRRFIDRRFYRRKYDAAKTLESFSTKLRNETDVEALNNDLISVVSETMQPAHVSLWLRPDRDAKQK
jgi:K+-sensing histidine kinase KdpD